MGIPSAATVKYVGLHLDSKLNWKEHVIKERRQMDLRYKDLYWLLGRSSPLSADNKLLLYKSIITPIWTYGSELWGCSSKSTIAVIQKCQSKILRVTVDASWYVTNSTRWAKSRYTVIYILYTYFWPTLYDPHRLNLLAPEFYIKL